MAFVDRTNFPTLARPEAHQHHGSELVKGSVGTDQLVTSTPRGILGYAQVTANQTFTVEADITGTSVTFTVPAGRRLKISGRDGRPDAPNATDVIVTRLRTATVIYDRIDVPAVAAGVGHGRLLQAVVALAAGSYTFKLSIENVGGAGNGDTNASADNPAYVLVEDIGSA